MKNLLEYLLIHIVDHPEDVKIEVEETDRETRYIIHVNAEDMGRVIGRGGAVIDAIRRIAKVRAIKEGTRVYITIAEPAETADQAEAIETSDETVSETDDTDVEEVATDEAA